MATKRKSKELGKDVDLFGAPITQIRERWGRKSFAKNKENSEFVCLCVASGMSQDEIAEILGCDPKTLRKHFSRELTEGTLKIRTQMLQLLFHNAKKGNNAAIGKILHMLDTPKVPKFPKGPSKPVEPKVAKLGKKEQLQRQASEISPELAELLRKDQSLN